MEKDLQSLFISACKVGNEYLAHYFIKQGKELGILFNFSDILFKECNSALNEWMYDENYSFDGLYSLLRTIKYLRISLDPSKSLSLFINKFEVDMIDFTKMETQKIIKKIVNELFDIGHDSNTIILDEWLNIAVQKKSNAMITLLIKRGANNFEVFNTENFKIVELIQYLINEDVNTNVIETLTKKFVINQF